MSVATRIRSAALEWALEEYSLAVMEKATTGFEAMFTYCRGRESDPVRHDRMSCGKCGPAERKATEASEVSEVLRSSLLSELGVTA